jgi:uncharacterized membrane protein
MLPQILFVFVLILMSGLFHILPSLTRPDLFFAVTIAPEFRHTADARRILLKFRVIVWSFTLLAVALELVVGMAAAAILLMVAGFLGALVDAHRAALQFAATPSSIREVDLSVPPERLPGGPIVALLPVLFLGALGAWIDFHWDRLPPQFPVHWGLHGADRWVTTTPRTVFGFLAIHALLCLLMAGIAWGLLHWSRRVSSTGPSCASESHFRGLVVRLLIANAYLLVFPAWFGLFHPSAAVANIWGLALTIVIVVFSVLLIRAGQGGSRAMVAAGIPVGDRTPDLSWKWGLIYFNPADPSIFVEKRFGIGYTLNFGNRWGWVALAVLVLFIASIFLLK